MKKLVIVNGFPGAGKDTFVDLCMALLTLKGVPSKKLSSVDKVKEAAAILGCSGKSPVERRFLADLKDLSTKFNNGPYAYISYKYNWFNGIMFVFVREPEEIEKLEKQFPEAISVLVEGRGDSNGNNHADCFVTQHVYNVTIDNSGTREELVSEAQWFVETFLKETTEPKQTWFSKIFNFLTQPGF